MFVHLRLHTEFSIVDSTCRIDDVVQAAVRLTAWIYRQRDAPFGQTARPEIGVIETPLSMPPDVVRILAPFVKARVSGV